MRVAHRLTRAADPNDLACMAHALDSAWQQVAHRFMGAPPETITLARNALAEGIVRGFNLGATDLLPLKHGGLNALKQLFPERFPEPRGLGERKDAPTTSSRNAMPHPVRVEV